ncbi:MAG: hypothetical protein BGN95_18215 [Sphingomonas sp. 66-10]|nr:MAG: hypothetical protein BGN95_18215 [Sphingomonas sp. 66-10]
MQRFLMQTAISRCKKEDLDLLACGVTVSRTVIDYWLMLEIHCLSSGGPFFVGSYGSIEIGAGTMGRFSSMSV